MQKITFLLLILLYSISVFAQDPTQGTLYAVGEKGDELGECPLKHTSVKADISGFLTRVTVTQEFENNFSQPIEAVYTFPLSQNSAVDQMTMKIGERTVRGKIMKKEEAKQVYETAKAEGKTASLLDQERPNIFTQSVANILPNEKILIEISYVETLKYEDGVYEFVFPMVVGPRYIPKSVKVSDAKKISPPIAKTRAGHDISIEVNLRAGVPIEEIRSTSHEVTTTNLSPNSAKIALTNETTIPNRDFILRFDVTGKKIEDAILTHRVERGGYFSLILQPPDKFTTENITPKEIVFVVDTSGSMSGFPLDKAKESIKMSLENLYPNDTFNLITFAGDTAVLFEKPVFATQANLERAQAFLDSRQGGGGTEMMTAIKAALEPSDSQQHVRIVCFMTDGYVGNEGEIISEIQKHKNARIFSFGIGSSVNRFLLDKMAEEGRGEVEYVSLNDDGTKAATRFYERVRTPLLTGISIDWNGLPVADVYPNQISDLFSAKPVVIHGRYTKAASGTIKLKGKIAGQDYVREIPVNLPENEHANDVLATLWARKRIDELTKKDYDGLQNRTASAEIVQTITNLGLEYRLLTAFTSFVAVEERVVNQNGQPMLVNVPVNIPEGVNPENSTLNTTAASISSINIANLPVGARTAKPTANLKAGSGSGVGRGRGIGRGTGSAAPPIPSSTPKTISGGVINGKATSLPKPAYPSAARAVNAAGTVAVQVTIDESGNVISAAAVTGHPLLQQAAVQAARGAKFAPTIMSGQPVKTTGIVTYNFSNPANKGNVNVLIGSSSVNTNGENRTAPLSPDELRENNLKEKLHFWIFAVVQKLAKKNSSLSANESSFVKDGKAEIQIFVTRKTPETLEKLKSLGFEASSDQTKNKLEGKISIEKFAELVQISEINYVLPRLD